MPQHRNLVRLDKHQSDAWKSQAQARKEPQGTGEAGLTDRNTFLPQGDKHVVPSCRIWHFTTVS